jgi:hypothetical protein
MFFKGFSDFMSELYMLTYAVTAKTIQIDIRYPANCFNATRSVYIKIPIGELLSYMIF